MFNVQTYPDYVPSGIEWIGDVPAHWDVRRVKYLLRECDARSVDGSEELLRVSQYTGVTLRRSTGDVDGPVTRSASLVGYKLVEPNNLVVNIMLAWSGSLGVSHFRGITSPAYCVYRFNANSHPWYYHHLFRSPIYKTRIKAASTGVVESRLRLYTDDLYRLEALVPPLPEQTAIVRFLDQADRRIRRYIRAKQKQIALLEEQKQAIIHHAVTGQIDVRTGRPYPAYKDSGVEWLGKVPEHWELRRLKWVTRLQRGFDLPADRRIPGPFSVVSSGGVIGSHVEARCTGPGVVMGRYGSTEAVFFVDRDFWPHNTSLFVTDFQGNTKKWCFYLLRSISKADQAGKSAVPGIDRKDLFQIVVGVPPVDEQRWTVQAIEAITDRFTKAMSRAGDEIDLLHEYRTRLISDVVTGKLDVRKASADLPEVDPPKVEDTFDSDPKLDPSRPDATLKEANE